MDQFGTTDPMTGDQSTASSNATDSTAQNFDDEDPALADFKTSFTPMAPVPHHDRVLKATEHTWVVKKFSSYRLQQSVKFDPQDCAVIDGHKFSLLFFPAGDSMRGHVAVFIECHTEPKEKVFVQSVITIKGKSPQFVQRRIFHHCYKTGHANIGFASLGSVEAFKKYGMLTKKDEVTVHATIEILQGRDRKLFGFDADYDSKRDTGMVGLANQGATCYMNSLLQALYHTLPLRDAVYQMPTEDSDQDKGVALALQRVFYRLQTRSQAVSTTELTKSFGWTSADSFMQHDVQEFSRVLMDNLEEKMKGTPVDGTVKRLLCGKSKSYIKCINVDYESSREEEYYDIQLNVKGIPGVIESFRDYCSEETLDGDNQYRAEGHGLQDAKKGTRFVSFPPILHLQLKRFEYSYEFDDYYKVNDRFEFPQDLDLAEFLVDSSSQCSEYALQAVLVHSGTTHGGHYTAYIRPDAETQWFHFDDDIVERKFVQEAVEANFGSQSKHGLSNAYMLVYIRMDMLDAMAKAIVDVPEHLALRFQQEEENQKKQKHMLKFKSYTDAYLDWHRDGLWFTVGIGLGDIVKFYMYDPISKIIEGEAERLKVPKENIRIWFLTLQKPICPRRLAFCYANKNTDLIIRDVLLDNGYELKLPGSSGYVRFYTETYTDESKRVEAALCQGAFEASKAAPAGETLILDEVEEGHPMLFFVKYFDHDEGALLNLFRARVNHATPLSALMKEMRPQLPEKYRQLPLHMFHERKFSPKDVDEIDVPRLDENKTVGEAGLPHNSIIVLEPQAPIGNEKRKYDGVQDWYDRRIDMISVRAVDNDDDGVYKTFTIPSTDTYEDIQKAIARAFDFENPAHIQLFRLDSRQYAVPVNSTSSFTILELIKHSTKNIKVIYYTYLDKPVCEVENEVELRWDFMHPERKAVDHINFAIPRESSYADTVKAFFDKVKIPDEERVNYRIVNSSNHRASLFLLEAKPADFTKYNIRIEKIPDDQKELCDGESIQEVRNFAHNPSYNHGEAMLVKMVDGETVKEFLARYRQQVRVHDKEFSQWQLNRCKAETYTYHSYSASSYTRYTPFALEEDDVLKLADLGEGDFLAFKRPNKFKRVYADAAVKIHN